MNYYLKLNNNEYISGFKCFLSVLCVCLLQEIKDILEPSPRSHAIPALSKLIATLYFLASGSFQHTVVSLFVITLICAMLGILHWAVCK